MYKSKYSRLFKLKLAKLHSEEMSSGHLSELFGVSSRQIRYWRYVYSLHGANSFQDPAFTPTASNKLIILKKMWTNNWTINHTSAVFNLSSPGILSKWQTDYDTYGLEGLKMLRQGRLMKTPPAPPNIKPAEQMSEKELRDELEYLRAENAVLKKLEALAQKKRALAKKNR